MVWVTAMEPDGEMIMAREIGLYYIVKVRISGEMLNDGTPEKFDTMARAEKRAEACRFEGEYAEVVEVVVTEKVVGRFVPYDEH